MLRLVWPRGHELVPIALVSGAQGRIEAAFQGILPHRIQGRESNQRRIVGISRRRVNGTSAAQQGNENTGNFARESRMAGLIAGDN